MRARIARPIKTLTIVLTATLIGGMAASTTADAVTRGQTVATISNGHSVSWSTPAVSARHARIVNTVQGKDAATVITLADASAPTKYGFALKLPTGATTHLASDGSVVVLDQGGNPLGSFLKPWAKDATGKSLPTEYTLSGSTLTQIVHTEGATFPVTADPHYTWGWVSGTVYFNRAETLRIRTASSAASLAGLVSFPFGTLFTLFYYVIRSQAAQAYNLGGCYKISSRFNGGPLPWDRYTYYGGYCK